MGAIFRVPLARFDGFVPRGGRPLAELERRERQTFVLGAEREGLPEEILASCDEVVSIPLTDGAESLNVAAAGAIALYERARAR